MIPLYSLDHELRKVTRFWSKFWFAPQNASRLGVLRVAIGLLGAVHFATYATWAPEWISSNGWYDRPSGLYFIGDGMPGTGSSYRWSILYHWDSTLAVYSVCGAGLIASLLTAAGMFSRLAPFITWSCLTMIAHRAPWLVMPSEALLSACMFYLILDTGRVRWSMRPGVADTETRWTANLVFRLIQVQILLWMWFALASMLQQSVWWNGSAVTWVVEQGHSWLPMLGRYENACQLLTHGLILLIILSLTTTIRTELRFIGVASLITYALILMSLSGDWLYACTLITMSLAFMLRSEVPVIPSTPTTSA